MKNSKMFFCIILIFIVPFQLTFAKTVEKTQMLKFQPEGLTWEKMLSIVKVEGKPGLIYFKSTCGVCKAMEERFFSDEKAIKYIESNFVPFKIDIDKDKEGFILSKQFNIAGTPTLVFINDSGDMLNKHVGYGGTTDEYIKILQKASDASLIKIRADFIANPENLKAALEYADMLYKADEMREALRVYNSIINKVTEDTTAAKVYINMAGCYRMIYDMQSAVDILEQGLENAFFHDEIDYVHCWLGNLCCEIRRPIEHRDYLKGWHYYQMLPKKAEDFKTFNRSAEDKKTINYYFKIAKDRIPFAYLKAAIQNKTGKDMTKEINVDINAGRDIFDNLFTEAYEKKDFQRISFLANRCWFHEVYLQEAKEWLKKIIELPEGNKYLYTYIMVLEKCSEYKKAIELRKKRLENINSEKSKEQELKEIAALYFHAGEDEKGKAIFKKFYQNAENNIDKLLSLSLICNTKNVNIKQALIWAKRAIELSKDKKYLEESQKMYISPGLLYNLYAELLFKTGQVRESIEVANTAVEIASTEDNRRQYKENLEKFKAALK